MPNLPLSLKCRVLEDVACGLLYLHDRHPPVIHRDLTSRNILLTSSLVAKITDMGNSRIVTMRPGQMARTLTKYPGTLVYMPPEAQNDMDRYGVAMDIFSFGHLALFTLTQIFPGDLLPSTYVENQQVKARSEIERRWVYIEQLESQIHTSHPHLVELVKRCLQNDPRNRPRTDELLTRLKKVREKVEGEYGGSHLFKLDMVKLRLAKEVKEKDKRMEELTQHQAGQQTELDNLRRNMEEITRQLEEKVRYMEIMDNQINRLQREVTTKDGEIKELRRQLQARDRHVEELQAEIQTRKDANSDKANRHYWQPSFIKPSPRSPGQAQPIEKPLSPDLPKIRALCAIVGCSYRGYKDLNDLCPDCYREHYDPDFNNSQEFPLI